MQTRKLKFNLLRKVTQLLNTFIIPSNLLLNAHRKEQGNALKGNILQQTLMRKTS